MIRNHSQLKLCVLLLTFVATSAFALDPSRFISQYGHRAWRVRDGDLPGPAYPITQTPDGYLWVGTQAGLVRFDGVRFVSLDSLTTVHLPGQFINALLTARDGSLWIASDHGLSRWAGGKLLNVWQGRPASLMEDHLGKLWFVPRGDAAATLCQVSDLQVRCFGKADGIDFPADGCCIGTLLEDPDGSIWMSTAVSILRWKQQSTSTAIRDEAKIASAALGAMSLAGSPPNSLWLGVDSRGKGLGLQRLVDGEIKSFISPQLDGSRLAVQALFVDSHEALWIGTLDEGIYRIQGGNVDHYRAADGLSSDAVYLFHEDHDGNLWVSTAAGIDRFKDLPVVTYGMREGLSVDEIDGVLASRDNRIFVAGATALDILDKGQISSIRAGHGLPGEQVRSLLEDHAGQIWVAIDNTLSIYEQGGFTPIKGVDGGALGKVQWLTEDADHDVWVEAAGKLVRVRGRVAQQEMPTRRCAMGADREAGIWLLCKDGELSRYRHGQSERFGYDLKEDSARQILLAADGAVFGATDGGVVAWKDHVQRTLTTANGLPCDSINAMIQDTQGALWLSTACGLLQITAQQLQAWWAEDGVRFKPRLLDQLDGVIPGRAPFNGAARSADGRLWFANGVALQTVNPAEGQNKPPLPVHIEEIWSDRRQYDATAELTLPPNPRDVEINYTAVDLGTPQRVQFRYKLDGHDVAWQEPGSRRQAFYGDLPPGHYRFHVMASNVEGIWGQPGAQLDLNVAAAWYQTSSFRLLCALLGLTSIAALYRYRVRKIARALSARFDERLAERTRLARELHDTLLQTIQGSKMVADDALDESTDLPSMRRALTRLSSWLGQAMQEGRAALNSLRTSTVQTNDLAESFRRVSEEATADTSWQLEFVVSGETKDMHPIVRDEIFRIGYEAIRNVRAHAHGTRLEVALTYARDLILVVRDNGRGIDETELRQGKEGHFGLQGMRERAERIGSKLTLLSSPGSGTEIKLIVPGKLIFRKSPSHDGSRSS